MPKMKTILTYKVISSYDDEKTEREYAHKGHAARAFIAACQNVYDKDLDINAVALMADDQLLAMAREEAE